MKKYVVNDLCNCEKHAYPHKFIKAAEKVKMKPERIGVFLENCCYDETICLEDFEELLEDLLNGDLEFDLESINNGYDETINITNGLLEINRIDVLDVFDGDHSAAVQAMKDGKCKLIPLDEVPDFSLKWFGFIDTPENRKLLENLAEEEKLSESERPRWLDNNHADFYQQSLEEFELEQMRISKSH